MVEILTDALHRIAYATDASIYKEVPLGVAYPRNPEDIRWLVTEARRRSTHLIPRAGGTSIAGQVVGNGIVADISLHLNKILNIDAERKTATVQPGVIRDELNIALKPYGLFFSPETSTSNRCCIGGMFGNNSCGSHSLVYGSTRHHVTEAKGILSDGTEECFKEYTVGELEQRFGKRFWENTDADVPLVQHIYAQLINLALDKETVKLITESYPDKSLRRRSCGYAIDEVIEGLTDESTPLENRRINLCRLLCGSEGTLAFITEITVSLDPLPYPHATMLCAHCADLQGCFEANLIALKHHPEAIELIDRPILKLSEGNIAQRHNRFFIEGNPAGILCIELRGETEEALLEKAEKTGKVLMDSGLVYHISRVDGKDMSRVYALRKAGLGLLNGMKGDAKPIGVIEDTAIPPSNLGEFVADLDKMLALQGLSCVYYGHISTGELHLRPIINIKTAAGRLKFRAVAYETSLLVKKYHGSLSGEHGDGRLRGEFIPTVYGTDAYQLMREVKHTWDGNSIFNVGKIVDTPPMDAGLRYDVNQYYEAEKDFKSGNTYFNWKASFDECKVQGASGVKSQCHALMCSIEQCNGAGDCRKSNLTGGTMCPAYKVSRNELMTTRARANVLREILTNGSLCGENVFVSPELKEMLDSCLACKGCRSECPSNVDMTRTRAELLQQRYDNTGTPIGIRLIAMNATLSRLGMIAPWIYNKIVSWDWSSRIIKRLLHFATERQIPKLSRHSMRYLVRTEKTKRCGTFPNGKAYLFADEFTNYQEAELGLAFAGLLMALGYEVEIPKHTESGRAAISKGLLRYAKKCAENNVASLQDLIDEKTSLIGIEPSCILTFRDEYPDLVNPGMRKAAVRLAENCLLYDEFLLREIEAGKITADSFKACPAEIWLHGHCHQKSLVGIDKTATVLRELLGAKVNVIPSGCCGMAGSFGYEKEHYKTSLEIGEMVLFPAVREAASHASGTKATVVAAPGISCRQQIKDGTGITAVHPIEILYKHLNQ